MLIGGVDDLDTFAQLWLLLAILLFGLRGLVAVDLWADIVAEFVV